MIKTQNQSLLNKSFLNKSRMRNFKEQIVAFTLFACGYFFLFLLPLVIIVTLFSEANCYFS